jgi:uncharacterized protein (DUF58 family)
MAAWLYYFVFAWPTMRLAVLMAAILPLMAMFMMGSLSEAYPLGFAILSATLVAILMGWARRPRLRAISEVPVRVEAGSSFVVRYHLTNIGRFTCHDLTVESLVFSAFLDLRMQPVNVQTLPPGASCTVEGTGRALRRGHYALPPLRYDSDFPSGLWRWGRTDWVERRLRAYPSYRRLASLDLPDGPRNRLDVQSARQLTRAALEFHGCREYRAGDSLRHVHARSSARIGVPVVKEFQSEGRGRTAVLVDTWSRSRSANSGMGPDPAIEACLSVAASVVDFLARHDRVLELLVAGPGLYRFVSAGRLGFIEDVLDILASVEVSPRDTLPQLASQLITEIKTIESACLIFARWDKARSDFCDELRAHGVGVRIFVLHKGRRGSVRTLPPEVTPLSVREVASGKVASL